jgi:glycosyltransferase involved in cell wall biosynthesis
VKIGIDLTPLLRLGTGVDTYLIGLVDHLAKLDRGHRYRLFINREDRDRFDRLPPSFRVVPAALRTRFVRLLFQHGFEPLASWDLDVLHSPAFMMPLVRGRARHLLTVFDMTVFTMPHVHIHLRRSAPYQRAVLASMRRADCVTVPTAAVKRDVREQVPDLPEERIEVIGYGVGDEFRPHRPEEIRPVLARLGLPERYLLHVGTLAPRKNLTRLVDAYSKLVERDRCPEHLVLAGKSGTDEAVLERIDTPQLRDRVHLTGYLDAADLPPLYAGASLFIFPSLGEGFGFPPLEAMASGVPVIASRTPALVENLDGAASMVDPEDSRALAAEIESLLEDERRRRALAAAGDERAAAFRWDQAARRTLALYEELAAAPVAGRFAGAS